MRQDLRYALRTLTRTPVFTLVAILTLALGIGANTAIFSLVDAILLKPLPFQDPAKLVAVWDTYAPEYARIGVSPLELEALKQQTDLFEQTAWYRFVFKGLNLIEPGTQTLEVHATILSPELLPLLGVPGPNLTAQSVLISDHLAKMRGFAKDKQIRLNEHTYTVAGVMPPSFDFPASTDLWLPPGQLMGDELTNPVRHSLGLLARLRPNVTREQAAARVESVFTRLAADHPKTSRGFGVRLVGLQDDLTANTRPALLMLMAAVGLVLLIACGNVANLLLSRASGRAKEIAIRTAIGAGSGRIVRQLLTESLVLSLAGGLLGFGLAQFSLEALSPVAAPVNSTVLLYTLAIALLTGAIFGLAPALQARQIDPITAIKSGGSTAARQGFNLPATVIVLQFAFALIVVVSAGILAKSFLKLMHVDPGFKPANVLTMRLAGSQDPALFTHIQQRLEAVPGVHAVAGANTLPLVANRANSSRFNVPGSPLINPDSLPAAQLRIVTPAYFRALRIHVKAGRAFTERDLNDSVVIINEAFARRYWPNEDPIGRRFVTGPWGPKPTFSTIIGVAGDVKQFGLDSEPTFELYLPGNAAQYLIVRTGVAASAIEREVQAVDASLAISDVRTMDEIVAESSSGRRWTLNLLSAFALLALVLALIGIYGVMSWSVTRRTRDIGIRMAIGANRNQVMGSFIRQGLRLAALGLAIGTAGALAMRQILASLAFEVSTADPWIYVSAALLMGAAAMLACYIPARRASRVDPLAALRWD